MMSLEIAVVGAGITGLSAALGLARSGHAVRVIDRVPVAGGVLGHTDSLVTDLAGRCTRSGITWLLGETALRWRQDQLLVAGPPGIRWIPAQHVVVCTGYRPATLAELGITGARLSGVLPASAAVHLLESGAHLGQRPVVIGDGWWSERVCTRLDRKVRVTAVSADATARLSFAAQTWPGWRPTRLRGTDRVTGVHVERDGLTQLIACDSVIVGQSHIPYRNIDGALDGSSGAVSFVQRRQTCAAAAMADAEEAVAEIARHLGGT
jgi:D-hydroxyproline dehydrogenase subunit alpha